MGRYEFLLFDADYTLLDFDADMAFALEQAYHAAGFDKTVPYSGAMLRSYEEINNKWWARFEQGACTKQELFINRFEEYMERHGFSYDAERLNEQYFGFLAQGGRCLDGALEMVRTLSRTYKLYIVTNGNASSQKLRLEHSGLTDYILDTFVSETVGAGKPDIRYFDHVFAGIPGFRKEKSILIGDSIHSDIKGAYNAGIDSIWYNPGGYDNPEQIPYTRMAASFDDILNFFAEV